MEINRSDLKRRGKPKSLWVSFSGKEEKRETRNTTVIDPEHQESNKKPNEGEVLSAESGLPDSGDSRGERELARCGGPE
jgi:hypothetical protein